jgi:hypothetical protein
MHTIHNVQTFPAKLHFSEYSTKTKNDHSLLITYHMDGVWSVDYVKPLTHCHFPLSTPITTVDHFPLPNPKIDVVCVTHNILTLSFGAVQCPCPCLASKKQQLGKGKGQWMDGWK